MRNDSSTEKSSSAVGSPRWHPCVVNNRLVLHKHRSYLIWEGTTLPQIEEMLTQATVFE